jgi:Ca2+-binding EF-hand superfamily protein
LNEFHNDLSDRAKKIFTDWFNKYSIVDPDDETKRVMVPKTCAEFARSCTDDYCTEEDNRVVSLFALYDYDQDNKILLEDFLEFFRHSAYEKEDVVR